MKLENMVGMRFERLVVVARAESNKHGHTKWLCTCDCGRQVIAYASDLKRGGRPSCGCLKSEKIRKLRTLTEGEGGRNQLYGQYRKGAGERELSFDLTIEEFSVLVDKDCHYCGASKSLKVFSENRMTLQNVNGNFTYTGIDRKDSNLGYIAENCVTCCKACNFAKNDTPYDEFIAYLDRLVKFRSAKL